MRCFRVLLAAVTCDAYGSQAGRSLPTHAAGWGRWVPSSALSTRAPRPLPGRHCGCCDGTVPPLISSLASTEGRPATARQSCPAAEARPSINRAFAGTVVGGREAPAAGNGGAEGVRTPPFPHSFFAPAAFLVSRLKQHHASRMPAKMPSKFLRYQRRPRAAGGGGASQLHAQAPPPPPLTRFSHCVSTPSDVRLAAQQAARPRAQ